MTCVTCGCSDTDAVVITDASTGQQTSITHADRHTHDDVALSHAHHGHHPHDHDHYHGHGHAHDHDHDHGHSHDHDHPHPHPYEYTHDDAGALHAEVHGKTIALEQEILGKNQLLAERNRGWLDGREILALNLVSSPGSGKTSLLAAPFATSRATCQSA